MQDSLKQAEPPLTGGEAQKPHPSYSLLYVAALAGSVTALSASFSSAPYLSATRAIADLLKSRPGTQLLYVKQGTKFYVTNANLLDPKDSNGETIGIGAIVFDVWPRLPGQDVVAENLAWTQLIWSQIANGKGGAGNAAAAKSFADFIANPKPFPRGDARTFELPASAELGEITGIKVISIIPTRPNFQAKLDRQEPSQLLTLALSTSFKQITAAGVRAVGIPRITVAAADASPISPSKGWEELVRAVDVSATGTEVKRVVFGTWARTESNRAANAADFSEAWASLRVALLDDSKRPTHGTFRLWTLIVLVSLIRWIFKREQTTIRRLLALGIVAGGLAAGVSTMITTIQEAFGYSVYFWCATAATTAIITGMILERVIGFKASDELLE